MRRGAFLAGLACGVAAARAPARATGGLDVEDTPPAAHVIRVLLAAGNGFAAPEPVDAAGFRWNGLGYRGTFATVTLPDGTPGLVNTLPLDAYLYGVVSKEVSPAWPRAAQEAQAIVARTYALGKLRLDRLYDVLPGESDQRYSGLPGESVEGRQAVDATAGLVVTLGGHSARVAFSSCCGGFTADAGDTWGTAYPYLTAHADPYCASAPVFKWRAEIPYDALARALGGEFASLGPLERIELREPDRSGRPRTVAFDGAQRTFEMRTPDFRAKLGYGVVKSTLVRSIAFGGAGPGAPGGTIVVEGNGNGHGVGMCQWGARQMAAAGASAQEIVAFYFPATTLGRA
jgi:stage II sporulation protein D